jgi:acyl carrier protein
MSHFTATDIQCHLNDVLRATLEERGDLLEEPVAPMTLLGADLGIASVEVIHIMVLLEERLGMPIDFQTLAVRDGDYVADLSLDEITRFLCASLGLAATEPR